MKAELESEVEIPVNQEDFKALQWFLALESRSVLDYIGACGNCSNRDVVTGVCGISGFVVKVDEGCYEYRHKAGVSGILGEAGFPVVVMSEDL
jgi:hypothetical protein